MVFPVFGLNPNAVGFVIIPPSLYQSIPNDGTLGGFRLNFPLIEKCGSFSFGRLHEKLKNPFIFSIAPDTTFFAASSFSLNADFMLSRIPVTVLLAAFSLFVNEF